MGKRQRGVLTQRYNQRIELDIKDHILCEVNHRARELETQRAVLIRLKSSTRNLGASMDHFPISSQGPGRKIHVRVYIWPK